jgi:hypothetical protein
MDFSPFSLHVLARDRNPNKPISTVDPALGAVSTHDKQQSKIPALPAPSSLPVIRRPEDRLGL